MLHVRWGLAPRARVAGPGLKPPAAASISGLRWWTSWKRRTMIRQVWMGKANAS